MNIFGGQYYHLAKLVMMFHGKERWSDWLLAGEKAQQILTPTRERERGREECNK
jgi:hypothetical protein